MHLPMWLLADATPLPTPSMTVDPQVVSPGFIGFVGIAFLAVVVVFLLVDMLRRIRRAGYRADIVEELDAEEQAAAAAGAETPQRPADEPPTQAPPAKG